MRNHAFTFFCALFGALLLSGAIPHAASAQSSKEAPATETTPSAAVEWTHLSSATGERLPVPQVGNQVATLIMDIDGDGTGDFALSGYNAMEWFRRTQDGGWDRYTIEPDIDAIEAGGDFYDIDRDGNLDIVQGGHGTDRVWWWENLAPDFDADEG